MSKKREELRARLIEAAETLMQIKGLSGLRARDVTKEAGCALGGLYTAFGDLDDLILHVNARTLDQLSAVIEAAVTGLSPQDALRTVALEYARFAADNRALWDALFDHKLADDASAPDWFKDHQLAVMRHVIEPLHILQPDLTEADLSLRARTYFSAVHGIVSISLQGRFVGLPGDHLETEISRFVEIILSHGSTPDAAGSPP